MNIYIVLLISTIVIALSNAVVTFRKRDITGAKTLFLLMLAIAVYAFGYIFEIVSKDLDTKLIWYGIEYISIAALPFLWLFFALQYSDNDRLIINKKIYILAIIPVITIIMVWTNPYHGLMLKEFGISTGLVQDISKTGGIWYWVNIAYSYILTITGSFILISTVVNLPRPYLKQGIALAIGALIPLAGSFIYVADLFSFNKIDLTPFAFAISGIIFSWSLFTLKTLQIVPIARDKIFDSIGDAVIVVNTGGIIMDANKKTQDIFNISSQELVGQNIEIFLMTKNIEFRITDADTKEESIGRIFESGKIFYYSLSSITVEKRKGKLAGYLIVIHDITQSKKAEKNLSDSKQKIEGLNRAAFELSMCELEDEIFRKSCQTAKEIMGFSFCSFFIEKAGKVTSKFNSSAAIEQLISDENFYNDFVLKTLNKKIAEVKEVSVFPEKLKVNAIEILQIFAVLCIPVSDIGTALLFGDKKDLFNNENIRLTQLLIGHSSEALKRIWLQKSLREQAELDSLTGVYNRRYFNQLIEREVERSKRYNYPITLVMIDIDRFKEINDRYGHQTGDKVLMGMAGVIGSQIRKVDTLVRYGGDEFLLALPEVSDKSISAFVHRMRDAVVKWNRENSLVDFEIELSVGISCYDPAFSEPVEKIIHYADMDMYEDKKNKKHK